MKTLFFPHVVRPVRILPRQLFTGGGIELSFPISHSPVETAPVLYEITRDHKRIYVSCGEREIRFGIPSEASSKREQGERAQQRCALRGRRQLPVHDLVQSPNMPDGLVPVDRPDRLRNGGQLPRAEVSASADWLLKKYASARLGESGRHRGTVSCNSKILQGSRTSGVKSRDIGSRIVPPEACGCNSPVEFRFSCRVRSDVFLDRIPIFRGIVFDWQDRQEMNQ